MTVILFVLTIALASGALAYFLLQPRMQTEKRVASRRTRYSRGLDEKEMLKASRDRLKEQDRRRRTIQSSLKDMESRTKERASYQQKLSTAQRIQQAGLTISTKTYAWASVGLGVFAFLALLVMGFSLWLALAASVIASVGVPRFVLMHLRKRRIQTFLNDFPTAIDLIVRGVKSGLPLGDTLRMVATEMREPVRGEFEKVIEAQRVGMPLSEAVERLYRAVPTSDTNFFAIVIGIQSQAGGNLTEALSNLSKVLRERKRMKGKIQAMSMEAKASGGIIGALPIIVGFLVYLTSPEYITLLFVTNVGKMLLLASALWMACGIFVMKKMIAFDF